MYRKDSRLFTAKIIRFKRKKLHISPKLITITLWALLSHLSIRPGGGGTVWGVHRTHLKWEQSNPESGGGFAKELMSFNFKAAVTICSEFEE